MQNLSSSETVERNFSVRFFNTQLLKTLFIIHNSLIKREKNSFIISDMIYLSCLLYISFRFNFYKDYAVNFSQACLHGILHITISIG